MSRHPHPQWVERDLHPHQRWIVNHFSDILLLWCNISCLLGILELVQGSPYISGSTLTCIGRIEERKHPLGWLERGTNRSRSSWWLPLEPECRTRLDKWTKIHGQKWCFLWNHPTVRCLFWNSLQGVRSFILTPHVGNSVQEVHEQIPVRLFGLRFERWLLGWDLEQLSLKDFVEWRQALTLTFLALFSGSFWRCWRT